MHYPFELTVTIALSGDGYFLNDEFSKYPLATFNHLFKTNLRIGK